MSCQSTYHLRYQCNVDAYVQSIYTWSPDCPDEAKSLGLTCMPMLWSNAADKVSAFQSTVTQGYSNWAMAFNECVHFSLCSNFCSLSD